MGRFSNAAKSMRYLLHGPSKLNPCNVHLYIMQTYTRTVETILCTKNRRLSSTGVLITRDNQRAHTMTVCI
jgi:hypothetical protein